MSDVERIDNLARIGLRVLLATWAFHPRRVNVDTLTAIGRPGLTLDSFDNPNDYYDIINGHDAVVALHVMNILVDENLIDGETNDQGIQHGLLKAHVRNALCSGDGPDRTRSEVIADALHRADAGEEFPPGTFTCFAQVSAFSPETAVVFLRSRR